MAIEVAARGLGATTRVRRRTHLVQGLPGCAVCSTFTSPALNDLLPQSTNSYAGTEVPRFSIRATPRCDRGPRASANADRCSERGRMSIDAARRNARLEVLPTFCRRASVSLGSDSGRDAAGVGAVGDLVAVVGGGIAPVGGSISGCLARRSLAGRPPAGVCRPACPARLPWRRAVRPSGHARRHRGRVGRPGVRVLVGSRAVVAVSLAADSRSASALRRSSPAILLRSTARCRSLAISCLIVRSRSGCSAIRRLSSPPLDAAESTVSLCTPPNHGRLRCVGRRSRWGVDG